MSQKMWNRYMCDRTGRPLVHKYARTLSSHFRSREVSIPTPGISTRRSTGQLSSRSPFCRCWRNSRNNYDGPSGWAGVCGIVRSSRTPLGQLVEPVCVGVATTSTKKRVRFTVRSMLLFAFIFRSLMVVLESAVL